MARELILGLSAFYHDSAAVLATNNEILGAAQEERFSRVKGDQHFPIKSIRALLKENELKANDITKVAYYEKPGSKLTRILWTQAINAPWGWRQAAEVSAKHEISQYKLRQLLGFEGIDCPIKKFSHHQSHAASAYFPSPFSEAAILTLDGVGEWATASISYGKNNQIHLLKQMNFPNSIGLLFATFTAYCGFKVNSGEYKLMGLAPYGYPKYKEDILKEVVNVNDDGSVELNFKFFNFTRGNSMFSKKLEDFFGKKARLPEETLEEFHCDIASSIQSVIEESVLKSAKFAVDITKSSNLVYAGGVALNCVANEKLASYLSPDRIFIQPAAGDAGGALGAALLALEENTIDNFKKSYYDMKGAFLGTQYSDSIIEESLKQYDLIYTKFYSPHDKSFLDKVVSLLLAGDAIGWFQGRMEFGPRSLGARSIIADARDKEMQKKLNLKVKKRESFRPFAPIVLGNEVHKWFNWPKEVSSPYMLFTSKVLDNHRIETNRKSNKNSLTQEISRVRSRIPAVTHVDFSARIQTIHSNNPIYELWKLFAENTGVPILVNTSFNVRGEPIVESPEDAIKCFLSTDLDALVIGSFIVEKNLQDKKTLESSNVFRKDWPND
jgi:carbamoyltransferase